MLYVMEISFWITKFGYQTKTCINMVIILFFADQQLFSDHVHSNVIKGVALHIPTIQCCQYMHVEYLASPNYCAPIARSQTSLVMVGSSM